jgi:hypothetical protein
MLRALLTAFVIAAATAAPAGADHVSCRVGDYSPGADMASPTITNLEAHNLPRRTDGYAPRCLVAEAIVGKIQFRYERSGKLPAKVRIYGARWNGGRWRCAYPEGRGICRRIGKPHRRVTMSLQTQPGLDRPPPG